VAEYLAALASGELADAPLAAEMRGLLDSRLVGLSEATRQVLGAAAAVGRSFDFETVRGASGRTDEEAVTALEDLIVRGVVRETQGSELVYDFSHSKLRELVYDGTGLARRRLLHKRIAAAIGAQRGGAASAGLIASHLRLAGDGEGSARHHRLAAEHAMAVHAHADALDHLEAALVWDSSESGAVHERVGDVRVLLGDYAGALASYGIAIAYGSPESQARIGQKTGGVHHRRGDWDRAEAQFMAALDAAPPEATGLRARILADLGLTLHQGGQPLRATELAQEALGLAEAADDRLAEAQVHNILGVFARSSGDAAEALNHLERSLDLAQQLDDGPAEGAALNNLALVRRDAGEIGAALELSERALALYADYGDRHREAALENNVADLHHAAGHEEEAMVHLKRAVALFSEVGADEATRLPEIWKLVSW
jgi:tetratricopeptide (TPR) repeat protein